MTNFTEGSHHDLTTDHRDPRLSDTTRNSSFIQTIYTKQIRTQYHDHRHASHSSLVVMLFGVGLFPFPLTG